MKGKGTWKQKREHKQATKLNQEMSATYHRNFSLLQYEK